MANDRNPAPPAATDSEEGFLSRWSRRKAEVERVESADGEHAESRTVAAVDTPATAQPPEPALTDADMPPLNSLGPDSDYSPFWSPGVSEHLRKLALRKLFASPQFNIRDGLDDYDEDYTIFEPLRKGVAEALGERSGASVRDLAQADEPAPPVGDTPSADAPPPAPAGAADPEASVEREPDNGEQAPAGSSASPERKPT